MDGFNKRLSESVQLRLSVALSLTIVLVAVAASAFVFVSALDEAHKLQDDTLRQVAMLYDRQHMTLHYPEGPALKGDDEESRVIIQHLTDSSQALANGDETLHYPYPPPWSMAWPRLMSVAKPFVSWCAAQAAASASPWPRSCARP